jgi:hypothetical protein
MPNKDHETIPRTSEADRALSGMKFTSWIRSLRSSLSKSALLGPDSGNHFSNRDIEILHGYRILAQACLCAIVFCQREHVFGTTGASGRPYLNALEIGRAETKPEQAQ